MKNVNLELYKIFYEVGKQKNITKAANSLYISQPAITQQIQKLEKELNYKLFYRTKYGVEFTAEGEKIFQDIEEALKILESVPDNLDKFNNVANNLQLVSSYGSARMVFGPKIPAILEKYPAININIDKYDNEGIIHALLNNYADIAVINTKSLNSENIVYYESIVVERIFVASKAYLKKHPIKRITIDNLQDYPFIATGKTSATRAIFEDYLAKNCISFTPKFDIDSYEMALELILGGHGISVFNKPYIEEYLKDGTLIALDSDITFPSKSLYVAMNKNNLNNSFLNDVVKVLLK